MAYENSNLELIVVYNNSKTEFEKVASSYYGKLVLITGSTTSNADADKKPYIYASNEDGTGKYIPVPYSYLAGFKVGTTTVANPDKVIEFAGANGISVSVSSNKVTIDGSGLIGTANDASNLNTINAAKKYAEEKASGVLGTTSDTSSKETVRGTRKLISETKSTLEGASTDTKDSTSIAGAKKYADHVVGELDESLKGDSNKDTHASSTIAGAKKYADKVKSELMGDKDTDNSILGIRADLSEAVLGATITITESNGNYVVKQGDTTIGTITIPKDMVVESGTIVVGNWSNNTFIENASGTGKALKLTIKNQTTPIYINVADLVDVYTAKASATQVQIAISNTNEISATIVAKSIGATELKDLSVTNAKIANSTIEKAKLVSGVQTSLGKADTAYQKPSGGIPATDLSESVQGSLEKADSAIQSVTTTTPDYTEVTVPSGEGADSKNKVVNVKTTTMQQAMAGDLAGTPVEGVVPTQDIFDFLKARLSVKVQ